MVSKVGDILNQQTQVDFQKCLTQFATNLISFASE